MILLEEIVAHLWISLLESEAPALINSVTFSFRLCLLLTPMTQPSSIRMMGSRNNIVAVFLQLRAQVSDPNSSQVLHKNVQIMHSNLE